MSINTKGSSSSSSSSSSSLTTPAPAGEFVLAGRRSPLIELRLLQLLLEDDGSAALLTELQFYLLAPLLQAPLSGTGENSQPHNHPQTPAVSQSHKES